MKRSSLQKGLVDLVNLCQFFIEFAPGGGIHKILTITL
jgi:hypothetical protein